MEDDFVPPPETSGRLGLPPRVPPTAIGLLTPPPPSPEYRHRAYRSSTMRRRLAQGFVGVASVGIGSGVTAVSAGPLGVAVGVAVALIGIPLLIASMRPDRVVHLWLSAKATPWRRRRAA